MKDFQKISRIIIIVFIYFNSIYAQRIGEWNILTKYNNPKYISFDKTNNELFVSNNIYFYKYNIKDANIEYFNKLNGLNDILISRIYYCNNSQNAVIAYSNGNIDLIDRNNKIKNIPYLLQSNSINTAKNINHITDFENTVFLSCEFGIQTININNQTFKETFFFYYNGQPLRVNATAYNNGYIIAATDKGYYIGDYAHANLLDFNNWHLVNLPNNVNYLPKVNAVCAYRDGFAISIWDKTYYIDLNENVLNTFNHPQKVAEILHVKNNDIYGIFSNENQASIKNILESINFNPPTLIQDVIITQPNEVFVDDNGNYWIADEENGLLKRNNQSVEKIKIKSPNTEYARRLSANNGELWVAPGILIDGWLGGNFEKGIYSYVSNTWQSYEKVDYPTLQQLNDINCIIDIPERNEVYAGSFTGIGGILKLNKKNNQITTYNVGTSLQPIGVTNNYRVSGLAFEHDKNLLWMSNYYTEEPLSAYNVVENTWKSFYLPNNEINDITIDAYGNKWIDTRNDLGIIVFNEGSNFQSSNDDKVRRILKGESNGNLNDNESKCIALDKNGAVWVGGKNGITIFECGENVFNASCKGRTPILNINGYYSILFDNEIVNTIAIDEANRKWIGTNNGLWLMSEDGDKELKKFNTLNSPLISNEIMHLAYDKSTGILHIATSIGIMTYQTDALESKTAFDSTLEVYPNPVRPDYFGDIAIKGLMENSEVKITDIAGNLVHEMRSNGGIAIWNGNDINGKRVSSGVYTVYCADEAGTTGKTAKISFIH